MTLAAEPGRRRGLARWGLSFLLVLATHGALALALLNQSPSALEGDPSEAITLDLSPEPSAATLNPEEPAGAQPLAAPAADAEPEGDGEAMPPAPDSPPPQFTEAKPLAPPPQDPFPPVEVPDAEIVLPTADKPDPAERRTEAKPDPVRPDEPAKEERLTAASQAQEAAAAAAGSGGRPSSAALATWRSRVALHLTRFKRYPAEAATSRQQGTATVRFTMDSGGRILSRSLVQGSGSAALDQEGLAMIARAQPLPVPPPGLPTPIVVDMPVRFSFR